MRGQQGRAMEKKKKGKGGEKLGLQHRAWQVTVLVRRRCPETITGASGRNNTGTQPRSYPQGCSQ